MRSYRHLLFSYTYRLQGDTIAQSFYIKGTSTLLQHYTVKQWVYLGRGLCLVPTVHGNLLVATTNSLNLRSGFVFLILGMLFSVKDEIESKRKEYREGPKLGSLKDEN